MITLNRGLSLASFSSFITGSIAHSAAGQHACAKKHPPVLARRMTQKSTEIAQDGIKMLWL